ncbi:MAG: hypothetical protein ACK55I_03345, partial [bacterium]
MAVVQHVDEEGHDRPEREPSEVREQQQQVERDPQAARGRRLWRWAVHGSVRLSPRRCAHARRRRLARWAHWSIRAPRKRLDVRGPTTKPRAPLA